MTDAGRVIDRPTILFVHERALARFPNSIGHHVHRAIKGDLLPRARPWGTIFYLHFATRMGEELERCSAFGTKIPLANRRLRIAFDGDEFAMLMVDELATANAAVGANRFGDLCVVDPGVHLARLGGHRLRPRAVFPLKNLARKRPFENEIDERRHLKIYRTKMRVWLLVIQ